MDTEALIQELDDQIETRERELSTLRDARAILGGVKVLALPSPTKAAIPPRQATSVRVKPLTAEFVIKGAGGGTGGLINAKVRQREAGNADFDVEVMGKKVFCPTRNCRTVMIALAGQTEPVSFETLTEKLDGAYRGLVFAVLKDAREALARHKLTIVNVHGEGYRIEAMEK